MGSEGERRGVVSLILGAAFALWLLAGCNNAASDEVVTTPPVSTATMSVTTIEMKPQEVVELIGTLDYFIVGTLLETEGQFLGVDVSHITAQLEVLEPEALDAVVDLLTTDGGQQGLLCYFLSTYVFAERYWYEQYGVPIGPPSLHTMAHNRFDDEISYLFDLFETTYNRAFEEADNTPGTTEMEKLEWASLVAAEYAQLLLNDLHCLDGTTFDSANLTSKTG